MLKPTDGIITVFDQDIWQLNEVEVRKLQRRWGVLFQQSALFSSLNILENILFPLQEFTELPLSLCQKIALMKLQLVGLSNEAALKYPSELSGGMQKRAALARALALDPELLFLDEPSSGLDPASAATQDILLQNIQRALNLSIVMITHDLNTLTAIADHIIFLGEGVVLGEGNLKMIMENEHPLIKEYFSNNRAHMALSLERSWKAK